MSLLLHPPHRAEHLGSLKRPAALLQKRDQFDQAQCSPDQLRDTEDVAIADVVQRQRDVGLKTITDGEFRRHMFFDGVFDQMKGMKYVPDVPAHMFMEYVPDVMAFQLHDFKAAASYICEGKLERTKPFYVEQFEALKALTSSEEHGRLKLTVCAPEWYHLRHGPYAYSKEAYKTDEEYFADIAAAYRAELKDLYAAGCRHVQFDDPLLAYFCAESMIKGMEERGIDHEALLDLYIQAYNDCLKDRPADMVIGLHLCRGNFRNGIHFSEGGYDRIAIKLFRNINVDVYYLEYDTPRAGTFEPLKYLPKNKSVVLGLVTSKSGALEDKEELKQKINDAARVIADGEEKRSFEEALNQICISPQCGFASHAEGNPVTDEDVWNKLSLVVQTAREIWADA